MPRMTVSVPDDMLKRFRKRFPEVNVAEVVRRAVARKVEELEKFEELKAMGMI
jgi:metal-responsive CopG/Arc/MetJ family transcriptional regulator